MLGLGAAALPSGVVTFVFTDIESSTALVRELGEQYPALIDRHHECLREVWRRHRGHEVGTEGDSFFVVFAAADDAIAATLDAQRALASVRWPTSLPVRVRMGVHTGFARPHGGDYHALAVNQAARVSATAHGGQIIVSADAARAVSGLPEGAALESLGRYRVRDHVEAPELFALRTPDLDLATLPPRARPADGHNLLKPATGFLNRDGDLAALRDAVGPGRLVTVVGPGGVGKTRLVVEHGLETAPSWPDGVWFVDLSTAGAPSRVDEAVAEAVGADRVPGQDTRLDVVQYLGDRSALVILDNCEHVAPGPAELAAELVQHCPGAGVLATSRTPLGLRAEDVHWLGPLAGDSPDAPAIQLFLERCRAPGEVELEDVAALCDALDGIPLAIELAAIQSSALGPGLLLARLRSTSSVLRSTDPTLPDRQRTLDALLDWSHDLLDDEAADLLHALAVFAGGFDVGRLSEIRGPEVTEPLSTLIDHSLVVRDIGSGSPHRFRLLGTVRSYARSRGDESTLVETARELGTSFLTDLGPERSTTWKWVSAMAVDLDNIRAVIDGLAGIDDTLAQALACSVGQYHDRTSAFATGIEELSTDVGQLVTPSPERVALLAQLADLQLRVDHLDAAADTLEAARAVQERCGPPPWDDACLERTASELALKRGEVDRAVTTAEVALAGAATPRSRARLLSLLGIAYASRGDLDNSIDAFQRELPELEAAGLETFLADTHGNLAESLLQAGDEPRAAAHQLLALEESRIHPDPVAVAFSVLTAAHLAVRTHGGATARSLHAAGLSALDDAGFALYPTDRAALDDLVAAVDRELSADEIAAAVDRGRALGLDTAADLATEVLDIRSRQSHEPTTREER